MTQRSTTILRLFVAGLFVAILAACGGPTDPVTQHTLTVAVEGAGTGTVTSVPGGINVTTGGAAATFDFNEGTEVVLTAQPAAGSTFAGWGGACEDAGTAAQCTVTLDADTSVTATFAVAAEGPFDLTVRKAGSGDGTVTSDVGGIDLAVGETEQVAADLEEDTIVTLTAAADEGSTFIGWSGGGCTGTATTCAVTMTADTTVTATFAAAGPFDLTVQKAGSGDGTVVSDVGGIDIAVGETQGTALDLEAGTVVTLTATPDGDSTFAGWSGGGCGGTATTCVVTLAEDTTVTATFGQPGTEVTETFTITNGANDVEEFLNDTNNAAIGFVAGSIQVGSTDLDIGYDAATAAHVAVGLRFMGVSIPQGATITSATLSLTRFGTTTSGTTPTVDAVIYGEATDNALIFVGNDSNPVANFDVTSRDETTATRTWRIERDGDPTKVSPDLSAIVQEIVSRGGWTSGNALVLVVKGASTTGTNSFRAQSANTSGGTAPILTVTYTAP